MRDKDNDLVVVKANRLIQKYKYTLSKLEMRIVNTIACNVRTSKYDEEANILAFDINEFCNLLGLENAGGYNYKIIKKALYDLSNKSSDYINFGTFETIVRWIEKPIFEEGTGIVKLKLDDLLKPFFLQESGNMYAKLDYFFEMDSKYSMRLYELLKSYDGFSGKKFELLDLRANIDALGKTYDSYGKFKQRVLDPSVEEINRVTDLFITYKTITRGRKVLEIEFFIKHKNSKKDMTAPAEDTQTPPKNAPKKDFTALEKSKIELFRPLYTGYEIEDKQVLILYNRTKKALEPVLFSRLPQDQDELIREAIRYLLDKVSAYAPEKIFGYLNTTINNEDWSTYNANITAADEKEAERVEKERAKEAAAIRLQAAYDAQNAEQEQKRKEFLEAVVGVDFEQKED